MQVTNEAVEFYRNYRSKVKVLVPIEEVSADGMIWNWFEITDPMNINFVRIIPDPNGSFLWELYLTCEEMKMKNGNAFYEMYLQGELPDEFVSELFRYFKMDENAGEGAKKKAFGEYCKLMVEGIIAVYGMPEFFNVRGIKMFWRAAILRPIPGKRYRFEVLNDLNDVDFVNENLYASTSYAAILRNVEEVRVFVDNYREIMLEALKRGPDLEKARKMGFNIPVEGGGL